MRKKTQNGNQNPNDGKNPKNDVVRKETEDMNEELHAKLTPNDPDTKKSADAKATEQKNPAPVEKTSTKKPAPAKKAPAKKRGRPASKKTPAKKAPVRNTPAKKAPVEKKNDSVKETPNQDVEQQAPDTRLDDILKLTQNNAEMIGVVNRKVNRIEERMDDMKNAREVEQTPSPEPTPVATTTPAEKCRRASDKLYDWLKGYKRIPGWVLLLLILMLLMSMMLADGALSAKRGYYDDPATTVVTAQHGAIAVNGNVTVNVYQDRAGAKEGAEVETSYTRPLVYLNYNGAEGEADDSVVIDTTQDGTRDVTVGDSTVKIEEPAK